MARLLDSLDHIETPEGVDLVIRLAGPVVRIVAWGMDLVIRLGCYMAVAGGLAELGGVGMGGLFLCAFLLEWLYPVYFEVRHGGATPGKMALGLQVVHDDGTPIGPSASFIRNLVRFVDFLPFMYGAGIASMMLNRQFKRLGDLAAGTVVIYQEADFIRHPRPEAPPSAPLVSLTRREQQAVLEFAERAATFSPERADELARLAKPLVAESANPAGDLHGVANYLAGSS